MRLWGLSVETWAGPPGALGQRPGDPGDAGAMTLWQGRFDAGPAEALLAFTASLPFDRRLAADDIAGSRAHVRGLGGAACSPTTRPRPSSPPSTRSGEELARGAFAFGRGDEDIHTAVERRVTELAGPAGAKLHTGRSRNDQVATDLRLWTKRELAAVARRVLDLQQVLLARAE